MTESAIAAPPQLDTFRVVYRAGVQRPDDSDTGSEPNWFAQGGPVTISCSAEKLVVTEADGRRRVVVSAPGATLSKQQTTDLTAALMAVPSLTEATVLAPGARPSKAEVDAFVQSVGRVPRHPRRPHADQRRLTR